MKNNEHGVPGSFYKRSYIYWYTLGTGKNRIRVSTGQTDLESAVEWIKIRPFGTRTLRKTLEVPHQFATKLWHQAKHNAKMKNILFKITLDDFYEMYKKSNGHCAVTGLPFDLRPLEGCSRRPYAPSIDRIERIRGYTVENCRIVCCATNLAMNEFGEETLWDMATSMVAHRRKKLHRALNGTISAHQPAAKNPPKMAQPVDSM